MSGKKPVVFHPFLSALYPVLFFYELNTHELWFSETLMPMVVVLIAACLLLILFKYILREVTKAGIFVSFFLILFFFYEAILNQISHNTYGRLILSQDPALFWGYGVSLILLLIGLKIRRDNYFSFTRFLNVVLVILILFPVASIGIYKIQSQLLDLEKPSTLEEVLPHFNVPDFKPDIYYIIVDSYTSKENLKTFWGYDNSKFLSYLMRKDFYVAQKSRSNYMHTALSMPSSLNMKYIHDLRKIENGKLLAPYLGRLVADNKVARFLKSIGYSYIHIGDFGKSEANNLHITYRSLLSPFAEYLVNKTWLKSLKLEFLEPDEIKRNNILYLFKKLEEMPELEEPTFVYAHIMVPHPPFIFDRDGNIPKQEYLKRPDILYSDQVAFTNKKLMQFIDKALSKSKTQPIIIIQGDHGFEGATAIKPDEKSHRRVFGILNAYYLPQKGSQKLYESITPVNTFRLIFDRYFGTNLGLLPDKSYFRFAFSDSWKFIPIPERPVSLEDPGALSAANNQWIEILEEYVQSNSDFYDSRVVLGWNYYLKNRHHEAIEQLKKAIKINSDLPEAYNSLGELFLKINRPLDAVEQLKRSLQIYPNKSVYNSLGLTYMKLNQLQNAKELFTRALNFSPDELSFHYNLGQIYLKFNDAQKSIWHYKETARLSPGFESYNNLGATYGYFNRHQDAFKAFKDAITTQPNFYIGYLNLGQTYMKLNRHDEALEQFKEVIRLQPDNLEAYKNLVKIYLMSKLYKETIEPLKESIRIDPNSLELHGNLGWAYANLNRYPEAIEQYEAALQIDPADAKTHQFLGKAYDKIQDGKNAIKSTLIAKKLYLKNNETKAASEANNLLQILFNKYPH